MNSDKIIITFDDDIIDVNIGNTNSSTEITSYYSGFKSDFCLTGLSLSPVAYPSGSDNCFRISSQIELNDNFLNNIIWSGDFLFLSSLSGNIYIVKPKENMAVSKICFPDDKFEKTGFSFNGKVFINSLTSVYSVTENNAEIIYSSPEDFIIWNNLNYISVRHINLIVLCEYNPTTGKGFIKLLNPLTSKPEFSLPFVSEEIIPSAFAVYDRKIYFFTDGYLNIIDALSLSHSVVKVENLSSDNFDFMLLNETLYFYNSDNKIFFLPKNENTVKYSGIMIPGINSITGYGKFIFSGSGNGLYIFESAGMPVNYYQETTEIFIHLLNPHILVASAGKYVYFFNLNCINESEKVIISPDSARLLFSGFTRDSFPVHYNIRSALMTSNQIISLTSNGILSSFSNDLLNINL